MKSLIKYGVVSLLLITAILLLAWFVQGNSIAVLEPQGIVAEKQRNLLIFTVLLSMVVIIPVFIMATVIAIKYREGNSHATYMPEWDHNKKLELIWWGIPVVIISILAVITWFSSHDLDPYKPLESAVKPVTIEVVALQWKWLFVYPEHNVASVNYVQFPKNTPVNFKITADAPMNSFWIPQLGGQVYAMSGMTTKLHLMAHETGTYNGVSANISGEGFADMKFTAEATTRDEFSTWLSTVKRANSPLSTEVYTKLAAPGLPEQNTLYSSVDDHLFDTILNKYMGHKYDSESHTMDESMPMTADTSHDDMYKKERGNE